MGHVQNSQTTFFGTGGLLLVVFDFHKYGINIGSCKFRDGVVGFRESQPMLRKYDPIVRILRCHPSKDSLTGTIVMVKDLQHYYQTASS
jgi:hypothetical protein